MDGAVILKNSSEKFCTINQNQNKYISLPHEKNTVNRVLLCIFIYIIVINFHINLQLLYTPK